MLNAALPLRPYSPTADLWLERAVLAAVVLASVVAISSNVADPDLWGHVQYGRDVLEHGLATKTTYSYLAPDYPWVNHENVMEVALAWGADVLGPLGLVIAKMLAGLAVLLTILYACRRQGAGLIASSLILLLTASGLAHYWSLRPQLFSFVAYTFLLALLARCFAGWEIGREREGDGGRRSGGDGETASIKVESRRDDSSEVTSISEFDLPSRSFSPSPSRSLSPSPSLPLAPAPPLFTTRPFHVRLTWLWLIPLLMTVWTNAHGGFLAGCAIFSTYMVIRAGEAYWLAGRRAYGTMLRFGVWVSATLLATFLNPYGYNFHLWLLDDLRVPRPEITEWLPPDLLDPQSFPLLLLIAAFVITLACSRRSWDLAHLIILVATFWQSLSHQRHIPFFALSVAFFLPRHLEDVLVRLRGAAEAGGGERGKEREGKNTPPSLPSPSLSISLSLILPFLILPLLAWKLYERGSDLKVHRHCYPVSALQFMEEQRLQGRVLCAFNWAQYALAAFSDRDDSPRLLVHVDGRCRTAYSQAMLDQHFDFLFGDQPANQRYRDPHSSFDPLKALEQGQPNLVLLDRGQPHSERVMTTQTERWVLLYQDSLAQLWGRRERYDDPQSPDFLPVERRRLSETLQQGHVTWPALPRPIAETVPNSMGSRQAKYCPTPRWTTYFLRWIQS